MTADPDQSASTLSDNEIVQRILGGDTDLYQTIIERYNRRLYRVTWAIVQDEHETEEIVQETYVRAYEHLSQFASRSLFSTWLTRIAVHEAWSRMQRRRKQCEIDATSAALRKASRVTRTPEHDLLAVEARTILEQAIDALPETQRSVFVLRSLEEMSTAQVAKCLGMTEEAVKMRFLRARQRLRGSLYKRARATGSKAFQFLGERCDRLTSSVLSRIADIARKANESPPSGTQVRARASIESDRVSPVRSNRDSCNHHSD
jgi:RNA polymerase sigma-70 factor (ECF subfamily)